MKTFINNLLRKLTGYQLARFDAASYAFRDKLAAFLDSHVSGKSILDIGSARGSYVKEYFQNVTTLDIEPPADVVGDIMHMPFKDESFACVVCMETLEHVKDPRKAVAEVHRILQKGGKFIASAPFSYELHGEEYGDYWRFTRQGWEELLKPFNNISIEAYAGTAQKPGWYLVTAEK